MTGTKIVGMGLIGMLLLSSCVQYRVVELDQSVQQGEEDQEAMTRFAMVRNNTIIPEYVINRRGEYPHSAEEAQGRYDARHKIVDQFIEKKYRIQSTAMFRTKQTVFGFFQIVLSPVVFLVVVVNDIFVESHEKQFYDSNMAYYLHTTFHRPKPEKPRLQNELALDEAAPIVPE